MKLQSINQNSAGEQNAPAAPPGPGADQFIGPSAAEAFISKPEVARRLKKCIRTISYWQRHGIIPYVKCGHSVYYKWTDVEAHLQKHFRACPPAAEPPSLNPQPPVHRNLGEGGSTLNRRARRPNRKNPYVN